MDGEHAVVAGAQHGGGSRRRSRLVVGELGVALVAGDDRATIPRPVDDGPEMLRACRRPGRIAGLVDPDDESSVSVGLADAGQVQVPVLVEGHRHCAQAGQPGAHLVRRVRDGRVQHGVACQGRAMRAGGAGTPRAPSFRCRRARRRATPRRRTVGRSTPRPRPGRRARRSRRGIRSQRPRHRSARAEPPRASDRRGCRPSSRRCRRAPRRRRRAARASGRAGTAAGRTRARA